MDRITGAKLKCIRSANKWRLYWMQADMKWHEYQGLSSSNCLDELVQEIVGRYTMKTTAQKWRIASSLRLNAKCD